MKRIAKRLAVTICRLFKIERVTLHLIAGSILAAVCMPPLGLFYKGWVAVSLFVIQYVGLSFLVYMNMKGKWHDGD